MSSGDLDLRMKAAFDGNFIAAPDIPAEGVELTIAGIVPPNEEKDASGKIIDKPIISFAKAKKRFIVNATNFNAIRMLHGQKVSEWIGKKVFLTVRYLEKIAKEKNVPVVRIRAPREKMTLGMRKWYGSEKPFEDSQT